MRRNFTPLILPLFLANCFSFPPQTLAQSVIQSRADAKQLQAEQMQLQHERQEKFSEVTDATYHLSFDANENPTPISIQSSSNCNCWLTRDASWAKVPMTGTIYPANGFPCSGCPG